MAASLNVGCFAFAYGAPPLEVEEFIPRLFVVDDFTDANGRSFVDISEYINHNFVGHIQTVMLNILDAVTPTRLELTFGVTGARVSTAANVALTSGMTIMPYLAPADCRQHLVVSSVPNTHFQLIFTNVPMPLINSMPQVKGYLYTTDTTLVTADNAILKTDRS